MDQQPPQLTQQPDLANDFAPNWRNTNQDNFGLKLADETKVPQQTTSSAPPAALGSSSDQSALHAYIAANPQAAQAHLAAVPWLVQQIFSKSPSGMAAIPSFARNVLGIGQPSSPSQSSPQQPARPLPSATTNAMSGPTSDYAPRDLSSNTAGTNNIPQNPTSPLQITRGWLANTLGGTGP